MNPQQIDQAQWVAQRLRDHVSLRGWLLAILTGAWLWSRLLALAFG